MRQSCRFRTYSRRSTRASRPARRMTRCAHADGPCRGRLTACVCAADGARALVTALVWAHGRGAQPLPQRLWRRRSADAWCDDGRWSCRVRMLCVRARMWVGWGGGGVSPRLSLSGHAQNIRTDRLQKRQQDRQGRGADALFAQFSDFALYLHAHWRLGRTIIFNASRRLRNFPACHLL